MEKNVSRTNPILARVEHNFNNLTHQHKYIQDAVQFLENVLTEYDETTFISFNGGKDATIVLVLTYLALRNIQQKNHLLPLKDNKINSGRQMPQGIYFQQPNPFPEMLSFYQQMVETFGLTMHTLRSKKYAEQLTEFSAKRKMSCIIMGSRNDDPYCGHLELISESDTHKGYPPFKRINPIIKWTYEKVWTAIKLLEIPYCSLYEQGYTSIGNKDNTIKNPTLLCEGNRCLSPFEAKPQTERICRVSDQK